MTINFFLPESDDRVDPNFNFEQDTYCPKRLRGSEHDVYAHELYGTPQCDGYLMTRSLIGDRRKKEIETVGGVHNFLRVEPTLPIIADCGAFQYREAENPPYTCEETCEFYESLGFNFGISLDHMIFQFDPEFDDGVNLPTKIPTPEMERRFRLSIDNAKTMQQICEREKYHFQLIGGVQGWSPQSYHRAVKELIAYGLDYIALGGLARANDAQLRAVLDAVRDTVLKSNAKLHILGVARLSLMPDYAKTNVTSCDSASAILQAFKSNKDNYHTRNKNYTAVRIPPATGGLSPKVRKLLKREEEANGKEFSEKLHNKLIRLEQKALKDLRAYSSNEASLKKAMASLIAYEDEFGDEKRYYPFFEETLRDRPWEKCHCAICKTIGVEVIILRGNNRNRRRGFHNTWVFNQQFKEKLRELTAPPHSI